MTIKDDVRRVRRRCVEGLKFCLANGIKPTPGTWFTGTQACAIGAVFAKKGYKWTPATGLIDDTLMSINDEVGEATRLLALKDESDVLYLTAGFDGESNPHRAGTRSHAFHKLGTSLREKYVP